jgi:hypothetical protein
MNTFFGTGIQDSALMRRPTTGSELQPAISVKSILALCYLHLILKKRDHLEVLGTDGRIV